MVVGSQPPQGLTANITSMNVPQPDQKIWGAWMPGSGTTGNGIATQLVVQVGQASTPTNTALGKYMRFTTAATINTNAGNRGQTGTSTVRCLQNRYKCRFRMNQTANIRLYVGFASTGAALLTTDDPLTGLSGIGLALRAADTNFQIATNDGTGSTVFTTTGIAKDTNIHTFEIKAPVGDTGFQWAIDGGSFSNLITSDIPASTTAIMPFMQVETSEAVAKELDGFYWLVEQRTF